MRKGDRRRLRAVVTLLENPAADTVVLVEIDDPRSWAKKQQFRVGTGDLTGLEERPIEGCQDCAHDDLRRLLEQKVLKSGVLNLQIYSRAKCPSNHGAVAGDEPDDGKSSAYEEDES